MLMIFTKGTSTVDGCCRTLQGLTLSLPLGHQMTSLTKSFVPACETSWGILLKI